MIDQTIDFETLVDGRPVKYEARVDAAPVPRSQLAEGQLVVEHDSGDYAIAIDIFDGEYVANPIIDVSVELPRNGGECPGCGRIMSLREAAEQGACNDCNGGAYDPTGGER
jgi:hypothetical protein